MSKRIFFFGASVETDKGDGEPLVSWYVHPSIDSLPGFVPYDASPKEVAIFHTILVPIVHMSGVPKTDDYEEDVDYVDYDEESEDEDDFVPDEEDHHIQDDEDDGDDAIVPLLDGKLFVDDSLCLHYQGDGFHLSSSAPPPWNLLGPLPNDKTTSAPGTRMELLMTGPCDFESAADAKATPRKMKVTWTAVTTDDDVDPLLHELVRRQSTKLLSHHHHHQSTGPSIPPDQEDGKVTDGKVPPPPAVEAEEKEDTKASGHQPVVYRVMGQQIDTHGGDTMEFMGVYYLPNKVVEENALTCQVRILPATPVVATTPVAAASAARIATEEDDDEDEDYAEDDYEEGVDYNELIALHEDAGLSVDALQKRYRGRDDAEEEEEGKPPAKMSKKPPPPADDDDDDDYGF